MIAICSSIDVHVQYMMYMFLHDISCYAHAQTCWFQSTCYVVLCMSLCCTTLEMYWNIYIYIYICFEAVQGGSISLPPFSHHLITNLNDVGAHLWPPKTSRVHHRLTNVYTGTCFCWCFFAIPLLTLGQESLELLWKKSIAGSIGRSPELVWELGEYLSQLRNQTTLLAHRFITHWIDGSISFLNFIQLYYMTVIQSSTQRPPTFGQLLAKVTVNGSPALDSTLHLLDSWHQPLLYAV